jgi:hypothetical protein
MCPRCRTASSPSAACRFFFEGEPLAVLGNVSPRGVGIPPMDAKFLALMIGSVAALVIALTIAAQMH